MMPNISASIEELFTAKKWIATWMKLGRAEIHTSLCPLIGTQKSQPAFNYMDSWIQYLGFTIGPSQSNWSAKLQKMSLLCDIHRRARRSGNKQMKTFPEEKLKSYKTNDGMS
ncbi:hypothetical protein WN944_021442 [Citrus x changshan-huyou]|uniref:Uncharacterized protein n=1 Tax=Citrus x changshan-huyou TaxID=2935761 RepID=A0AAP0MZ96_9ROSI